MKTTRFEVKNTSGESLTCIEVLPDVVADKFPVVIMCHGFAYFKEEDGIFTESAKRLAKLGYAVYYFDFSGCGESEGDYSKTTLTKLIADLRSVYDEVTSRDYINSADVSLMSHSFGSNVIIGAQIMTLKRIVLSGSFTNAPKVISDLFPNYDEFGISARHNSTGGITEIGSQFWKDLKTYDTTALVHNFTCPILYLHGKKDRIVPLEYMYPLFKNTQNPVGPIILENSDHDLSEQRAEAFDSIDKFFSGAL